MENSLGFEQQPVTPYARERLHAKPPAGGPSVVGLAAVPKGRRPPSVLETVAAGVPPNVFIREVSSRDQARQHLKVALSAKKALTRERAQVKAELASKKSPVFSRMEAAVKLRDVDRRLAQINADIKVYRHEARSGPLRHCHAGKKSLGRMLDTLQRLGTTGRTSSQLDNAVAAGMTMVGDLVDLLLSTKNLTTAYVGRKQYEQLLAVAEKELERTDLPTEQREVISQGASLIRERMQRVLLRDHVEEGISSGIKLVYSISSFVSTMIRMVSQLPVAAVASNVASVVSLPLGVMLSLDGLWAVKNNLKQAKRDMAQVEGLQRGELRQAQQALLHLDDILEMPGLEEGKLRKDVVVLNTMIKRSQSEVHEAQRRLIDGNLTPEEIKSLKASKTYHSVMIGHYLGTMLKLVEDKPGLGDILERVQAKQVAVNGLRNLDVTLAPYMQQKLKTKIVSEYIRAAGEVTNLVANAFQGAGLVASMAYGTGVALMMAGVVLGTVSTGIIYGGGLLVNKIRHMQLGENRIRTKDFEAALCQQLEMEVRHWEALERAGLADGSTSMVLFPLIKAHYRGIPEEWNAKDWAKAIAEDAPGGPERKALHEAMGRMLYHNQSRGAVGCLVGAMAKRLRQKKV